MANYLLDTSCFYSISNKVIDLNKVKLDNSNILACPLSVFEIAKCENNQADFDQRKRAMSNLKNIITLFVPKSSDYIFDKSYSQKSDEDNFIINCDDIINCLLNSNTYDEAEKGIQYNGKLIRIDFKALREWKKELSDNFKTTLENSDKKIIGIIKTHIKEINKDLTEKDIKRQSKVRYKEIADMDEIYVLMVTELSIRAGLIDINEYNKAIEYDNKIKLNEFIHRAFNNYKYSLESYIKVYLEFRKEKILNSPEKNDLFDLDFMVYLDVIGDCIFVIKEDKWVNIGNRVTDNKFISKDDFINKFKYD